MELPASFTRYTRTLLGDEIYDRLAAALEEEPPVSIRWNEAKSGKNGSAVSSLLSSCLPVPWAAAGVYLPTRPAFTFDPLFHAGCYYVQEASSMFLEQAMRQYVAGSGAVVMLDLCAAPGGKSTHARSLLPEGSLLVANEVIRNRSQILAENLAKWGHPEVVVTNSDPADFSSLASFFDVILADVPCSGEGMFRKDPASIGEWSPENVEVCRQRQRRILTDVWPSLKPGGLLIYSTCTYNAKENEENVRWVRDELGAEVLPLDVPQPEHVTGNLLPDEDFPVFRFLPHATKGEGFFLAVLRKHMAQEPESFEERVRKPQGKGTKAAATPPKEQLATLRGWLTRPDDYELLPAGNSVSAFARHRLPELSALRSSLRIVQAGTAVAELKGRDWLPAHGLAMSTLLRREAFACQEVDYRQAIAYLRKEAVVLPAETPRGIVLLTYRQVPLGFVKNIGNRANNLYPQEWRIRSGYMPQEPVSL